MPWGTSAGGGGGSGSLGALTRRTPLIMVAVVLLAAGVATLGIARGHGLTGSGGGRTAGSALEPIRLGQPLPLSGDSRTSGAEMQIAGQMAVDHANATGGVN